MIEHVLVVDDSPQNRLVACGHLRTAGYRVTAVESGELALEELARGTSDLVVLDVLMPGLGGYETCRRIRATPAIADVPVLLLTALGDRGTAQPAIDSGADDLLGKPFNHTELLLRVRALIRQRRQARLLAAQNEAMRRISQMIVHDLRGPTTAIIANAEMLRDARLAGDHGDAVHDIAIASAHLDRTIHDLLDLSTAEDIGLEARMAEVELDELAADVATTLRGAGRWNSVRIACDVRVRRVVADRELLRRMLQNLVHNAMKHAPPHSEVTIEAVARADAVELRVLDCGPGVAIENVDRIFERYVSSGSHGLGLAFCRLVADAHDGEIWVEHRTPHGAAFCVRIPQIATGTLNCVKRAPSCS